MPITNSVSRSYRVTSTNAIVDAIHEKTAIPRDDIRLVVQAFNHYLADCIASGHALNFFRVGTIYHRFRKGRNYKGKMPQPDTLTLKFNPCKEIRARLRETCAEIQMTPQFAEAMRKAKKTPLAKFHAGDAPLKRTKMGEFPHRKKKITPQPTE